MDDESVQRRIENLQRVAEHLQSGASAEVGDSGDAGASQATPSGEVRETRKSSRRSFKVWGPLGVAFAFLLGKGKFVLALLKFAKLHTLLSMLVAVWAYAMIWGLPFAVGFVLLIFVHEMGHLLVMRQQGIPAGAPVFIPFVGAVIAMKGWPRNAYVEALVGIGGPALGTAGAIVVLLFAFASDSMLLYALASTGFLINLFNMIPISPLDGGRIVGVISRWFWLVGYAVGIAVFLVTYSPILFLILLLGLFTLWGRLRNPRPGYYDVAPNRRIAMGVGYFGLMAIMAIGMWIAEAPLEGIREGGTLDNEIALLAMLQFFQRD